MAEYPQQLVRKLALQDGTSVVIRPVRPEDADLEQSFVRALSEQSRYMRFMTTINELPSKKLMFFTDVDYDRHLALIATIAHEGRELQIGVARYVATENDGLCEFAVTVADEWQGKGIASRLMGTLMEAAKNRGFTCIEGLVFASNQKMLDLARTLDFDIREVPGESETVSVVKLL